MRPPHLALALFLSAPPALSQTEHAYVVDSGTVAAPHEDAGITIGFLVEMPGASSLRLRFSDIELARGASLRIVSLRDGGMQTHSQRTADEWGRTSAYFNGDAVWVEVLSQPDTDPSRVRLESITAGVTLPPAPSQCGLTDDRVLSTDPRVGRLQPGTCTGFLIDHCDRPMLTAGHCAGGFNLIEFNVPLSTATGALVHPPPSDQYAVVLASVQSSNGGMGADWAVFSCSANPNTGKTPYQAQLAAFQLQLPPSFAPALTMRVTGYGSDSSPLSFDNVQQTQSGPYHSLTGNVVRYLADTEGGNSGSPVILESTGNVIAIHTHAGCNSGLTNGNAGTSLANPGLSAALYGLASCAGTWGTLCTAQTNSQGCLPQIGAFGVPQTSPSTPSFTIYAENVLSQQFGILFYGTSPAFQPFNGGTQCVGAPLTRTPVSNSGGSTGGLDCSGVMLFDMGARIASGVDPNLHAGATIFAQFWTRDAPALPFGTNLTGAVRFTIGP